MEFLSSVSFVIFTIVGWKQSEYKRTKRRHDLVAFESNNNFTQLANSIMQQMSPFVDQYNNDSENLDLCGDLIPAWRLFTEI